MTPNTLETGWEPYPEGAERPLASLAQPLEGHVALHLRMGVLWTEEVALCLQIQRGVSTVCLAPSPESHMRGTEETS